PACAHPLSLHDALPISDARLIFRYHAVQRMFQRGISLRDVRAALETGETIETYSDDAPYPSRLVLGWVGGTRALHVVVADDVARSEEHTSELQSRSDLV